MAKILHDSIRSQSVDQCDGKWNKTEEQQHQEPQLEPIVMFLPVEHGQDDEWGHDKHLHVGPQVPSLTQAIWFSGQVGYV